jgi:hypothetical protein
MSLDFSHHRFEGLPFLKLLSGIHRTVSSNDLYAISPPHGRLLRLQAGGR